MRFKIGCMTENELSKMIIGEAIAVHKQLITGILESTYEVCLTHELMLQGVAVRKQIALPVIYKDV